MEPHSLLWLLVLMPSQRLMPTTVATMVESMVDMPQLPMSAHTAMPHTAITMDTHTGMEPTGSTSVKLRLSQRLMLMPTMLVPMDMEDSLPTMDMVPTHTAHTAMDIPSQLTTNRMATVVSTSVMPRLSQRLKLMPTMLVSTDMEDSLPTVDMVSTHTAHTDHMELTHTDTTDMVAHRDTDTTTKCLLKL